jgi:prophage regulatory protein
MKILRLKNVLNKTGDSRSGLYLKVSKGVFPKPIKLSARSVGWLESEVDNWIDQRIEATRGNHREKI